MVPCLVTWLVDQANCSKIVWLLKKIIKVSYAMSKNKYSHCFYIFCNTNRHVWCRNSPVACCMFEVWKFFEHSGIRKPWYLCFLSRILSSQFIFILVQFLGSRQSVSLPCLCVAGWWVALGSPACWLCPGMWSTGKTTPPCYWYSCVTTAVFNKQCYLSFENLKLPFFFF